MNPPPVMPALAGRGRQRWLICGLLFAATAINYMDRQVLGLLAPDLEKRFGWSDRTYADIVTTFQIAYLIGLAAMGPLLGRFGTKLGYGLSIGVWSLAIAAHALAGNALGFMAARAALGLGEAGNFPAAIKTTSAWFPRRERALANGVFNSGANVGALLAPLLVPWLVLGGGWRMPFLVLGLAGVGWLGLWWLLYADPERSTRLGAEERAWIAQDPPLAVDAAPAAGWRELLRMRTTWGMLIGFACSAPIWWFWLFWLPKLLAKDYGLGLTAIGVDVALVYALGCGGSVAGGWLSSHLIGRGWETATARRTALLACAACVLPVMLVPLTASHWQASLLIGLAAAAHQGWSANLFSLAGDHYPQRSVALVTSMGVLAGSLAAVVAAQLIGRVLDAGIGYAPLLVVAGSSYLAGWLCIRPLLTTPRRA